MCVVFVEVMLERLGVMLEIIRFIVWFLSIFLSWWRILFLWKLFCRKWMLVIGFIGRMLSVMIVLLMLFLCFVLCFLFCVSLLWVYWF